MQFLDFERIASYFQTKIENITYDLQERGELIPDEPNNPSYRFAFYSNKGDYHDAVVELNAAKDRRRPIIPVLIKNNGGIQDPTNAIDIYLQKVEIEVYGWCDRLDPLKDQWHDIELILSNLCSELKGITDTLDENTIKLDMSDYPQFEELENKHFVALLKSNMHIMFNAHLSNLDKIKINGVEIPYLNFTEDFTTELISDNKRTTEIKFMPNVYTYQLNVSALYIKDNSIVNLLVNGCTTGEIYKQIFGVEIIRDGVVLKTRNMYVKNFQAIRSYGSIVAYKLSLFPAYIGD